MAVCLIFLIKILFVLSEIKDVRVYAAKKAKPKPLETTIVTEKYSNDSVFQLPTPAESKIINPDQFNESTGLHVNPESNNNFTELYGYFNDSGDFFHANFSPKAKRKRLLEELMYALVPDRDEMKINILTDPEHPYINATSGQCFNHVITSFSKACIVSKAFGGWRMIKGFFAVACKALELKRQRIAECINRVCKKFPYLKI